MEPKGKANAWRCERERPRADKVRTMSENQNTSLTLEYLWQSDREFAGSFFDFKACVTSYLSSSLKQRIGDHLNKLGVGQTPVNHGEIEEGATVKGAVYISKGARIETGALVIGPCFIGEDVEVRHSAYIRGNVYVGKGAVVGHATEVKGSVFCPGAKAGHFAYVGDSILGPKVNLGAGTKCANLKLNKSSVKITLPKTLQESSQTLPARMQTGLKKLGALLAEGAQTGCNSVFSPGSILGPGQFVLPCEHFHGTKE